jgi:hypothetical protein
MKKSELTHIIREIVVEELRKQLPRLLAETFLKAGKGVVAEQRVQPQPTEEAVEERPQTLKESLREIFQDVEPAAPAPRAPQPRQQKQFTKNPVLNEILNQTSPFNGIARQQMGGMSPAAAMAAAAMPQVSMAAMMESDMVDEDIPSLRNVPTMPGAHAPSAPMVMQEGDTVSALDVKHHAPPAVKDALSRNYSQLMKAIDKKKKGVTA